MATDRNHNRTRSRWGMCLNDACEKSKNHERIEIIGRKDFVCPECGKPLKECPPPPPPVWPKYVAIAAAVLVLGGGGYWGFTQMGSEPEKTTPVDTTAVVQTPQEPKDSADKKPQQPAGEVQEPAEKPSIEQPTKGGIDNTPKTEGTKTTGGTTAPQSIDRPYGTVRVAYGTYTGDLRNGKPHGHGKVKFSSTYKINSSVVAHPGDTYEGEFRDGRISGGQGYWSHDGDMTSVMP